MTRIKICGINSAPAFDACIAADIDWIGFVFFPRSPRHVTPEQAAAFSGRSIGGPRRVGLFVAPTDDDVAATLAALHLDVLQLYADAPRVEALRERFGVPVWRAIGVGSMADLPSETHGADGFVVDAPASATDSRPGGNARSFDWSMLPRWRAPAPWLLAGGLDSRNVAAAIRITGAPGVDVSSGVESAPGTKDPGLIQTFVSVVRKAANG